MNQSPTSILAFLSDRPLLVAAFICAGLVIVGRIVNLDNFSLTVWGDRDLWRGLEVGTYWNGLGPETNSGFRPLGGFFYLLLNFVFSVWADLKAANLAVTILYLMSIGLVSGWLWLEISPRAGAIAALALTGAGLAKATLSVWNPGFILFFSSGVVVFTYLFIKTGKSHHLATALFFAALGSQIHLQISVLVIALPFIMAFYRIMPRWSHGLAVGGGLLAAYLPSILADPTSLFAFSAASDAAEVSGSVATYAELDMAGIIDRAAVASGNFFRATGGSAQALATALPPRLDFILWPLWLADILAAMLAAWAFITLLPGWKRNGSGDTGGRQGVFCIFAAVYFVVFLFSSVNFRHFVSVIPVLAILVAIGAENVLNRIGNARSVSFYSLATILLVAFLGGRSAVVGGIDFGSAGFGASTYLSQVEIARHVKSRFFPDHGAFEEHSSLFVSNGEQLTFIKPDVGNRMATVFYLASADTRVETPMDDCLLILSKERIENISRPEIVSLVINGLGRFKINLHDDRISESTSFYYLPYSTADTNCLKSFPNPYISTSFERHHLQPQHHDRPDGPLPLQISADRAGFSIPVEGTPFPWAVEFIQSDKGLVTAVHGREMRGHTGLAFQVLSDLTLSFTNAGNSTRFSFGKTQIGNKDVGTLVPWRSVPVPLPSGIYHVKLTASDWKGLRIDHSLGRLELSSNGIRTFRNVD